MLGSSNGDVSDPTGSSGRRGTNATMQHVTTTAADDAFESSDEMRELTRRMNRALERSTKLSALPKISTPGLDSMRRTFDRLDSSKSVLRQITRMQEQLARTLRVPTLTIDIPTLTVRVPNVTVNIPALDAHRRLLDQSIQRLAELLPTTNFVTPTDEGFDELAALITNGTIEPEVVAEAEAALDGNEDLVQAVDDAALALTQTHPLFTRETARRVVLVWVWLMWAGALFVVTLASSDNPALGAGITAVGVPTSAGVATGAGKIFDKLAPAKKEENEAEDLGSEDNEE